MGGTGAGLGLIRLVSGGPHHHHVLAVLELHLQLATALVLLGDIGTPVCLVKCVAEALGASSRVMKRRQSQVTSVVPNAQLCHLLFSAK